MLTRNSADARNCVQALIKYLQNLWLYLSAFNLTGTTTRLSFDETVTCVQNYYAFHEEASLKVQGIKGLNIADPRTRRNTICYYTELREDDTGCLSRLRTKVMELNPNFIQHLDVESLLTLFVENFFSSMRGGNTDTPMMFDFCLRFPRCINELLKRVTGTSHRYFTNPVASYYLQPTLGDVDINFYDLTKLQKPLSDCLSKEQLDEIRQWVQQYGKSVRQYHKELFNQPQARHLAIEPWSSQI